jgi:parvulin-like peptidyl-prolyl isomerase
MLLSAPEVRSDIGLTAQQARRIDALAAGFRADAGGTTAAPGKDAAPGAAVAKLDDEVAAYNRELAQVLTPAQRQRVREIQIQMLGNVALLEPPIQQQLGLSPEVVKQLDASAQENVAQVKQLRSRLAAGEVSADEFQTRVRALGRELDRRIGEVAPREALAKLAELGGRPFAGIGR